MAHQSSSSWNQCVLVSDFNAQTHTYRVILSEMVWVKTSMVSNSADLFVVCLSYDDIRLNGYQRWPTFVVLCTNVSLCSLALGGPNGQQYS